MDKGWRHLAFGDPGGVTVANASGNGVRPDGRVDRKAYALGTLEALHKAMKGREIFVNLSERWSDPRAKLEHTYYHVLLVRGTGTLLAMVIFG